MNKFYYFSLVLLAALLVFVMLMTGCILCFIDLASMLMVTLATIIMLFASFKPAEMRNYFKAAFSSTAGKNEIEEAIVFFRAMQKYLILSGVIAMMMGLIAMLAMLDDPDRIGAGLSLSLITVLYAGILNLALAIPFRTGLEKKFAGLNRNG